jgi:hypothetical protein
MSAQLLARLVEHTAESFDMPADELTTLQRLQHDLVELVRRAHEADERTARTFSDFMAEVSTRERARGR